MIMPIGDDDSDRRMPPVVNIGLIIANVLVFVFFQGMGENEKFTYSFSTVPAKLSPATIKSPTLVRLTSRSPVNVLPSPVSSERPGPCISRC